VLRQDERRANTVQNRPQAARTARPESAPPAGATTHGAAVQQSQRLPLDAVLARAVLAREDSRPAPRVAPRHGALLQRKLILNGTQRNTADDVRADLGTDFDAMQDLVEDLINLPGASVRISMAALREVDAFRTAGTRPTSREAMVATLQLLSHGAWTYTETVGRGALPTINAFNTPAILTNLFQLGEFLEENPNVIVNLTAAGVGWELTSKHPQIGNFGGGAVIEDRIHIADSVLAQKGFMRMVVHEAGHATFQRLLLTGEKWTDAANHGTEQPHAAALTATGHKFYEAWKVLRDRPEFFFIVDMPGTATASRGVGRRAYLAEQFTEFCADSFMHFALKEAKLRDHVDRLPDTEVAVKEAWQHALSVLVLYEDHILGDEAGGAAAMLASHRFTAALEELTTALRGPGLEVSNLKKVHNLLKRLRRAWQGLTPQGRQRHCSEALTALDMYAMKVQRRRPAQLYLGSELGFAGL
jgi:hypothetical protein